MKGQFMIISSVIASLIVISMSATMADIQSLDYSPVQMPKHINILKQEAKKLTRDGDITEEEKRNFRKLTGYVENYRVESRFNESAPCVNLTIESPGKEAQIPCIN